jgi:predicted metalloprotease with PDZ domain
VIPEPRDNAYPGVIELSVDASDVTRGIFRVQERVPVAAAGPLTLLYPEWHPGKHSARGAINLLAGLEIRAGGQVLPWRRDPVNVFAFHVDVPTGTSALDLSFQFVSPTQGNQGRIVMTREMLNVQWEAVLLYPAGYYASRIRFAPNLNLPDGWKFAAALDGAVTNGVQTRFAETDLETLVDSPLFAGRYAHTWDLDPGAARPVRLNVFADRADQLAATDAQIAPHRNLVKQAYRLFGSQHYDHYDFLFALTDRMGGIGLEHHRSSENGLPGGYFTDWDRAVSDRDLLAHEYTHSWNGKFRRPADLWTPGYDTPMRGSLLWVYEGMTQYWGQVLSARSEFRTKQQALDLLALNVAAFDNRVGREWRALVDTTLDPILSSRRPSPWVSWQRNEDYYNEGLLIWLDADTLIRERTRGRSSLDDVARAFFGGNDGSWAVSTYTRDDVVAALNAVLPYDWATFLSERVDAAGGEAPLDGIARGGYRLVYKTERNSYQRDSEGYNKNASFIYSIGLAFGENGNVTQVQWDSVTFNEGITIGTQVVAVNGVGFSADVLRRAITAAASDGTPLELLLKNGDQYRTVTIAYRDGLKYPHLERIADAPDRLGDILAPRER